METAPAAGTETVETAAGTGDVGPVVVTTVRGRRAEANVPGVGAIPTATTVTTTIDMAETGFVIRGTALFDSVADATRFVEGMDKARERWVDSLFLKPRLKRAGLYNAAKNFDLRRQGKTVAFAAAMSIADTRSLLDQMAEWTRAFFEGRRAARDAGNREAPGRP